MPRAKRRARRAQVETLMQGDTSAVPSAISNQVASSGAELPFSDAIMRWLEDGDRLHEQASHREYADDRPRRFGRRSLVGLVIVLGAAGLWTISRGALASFLGSSRGEPQTSVSPRGELTSTGIRASGSAAREGGPGIARAGERGVVPARAPAPPTSGAAASNSLSPIFGAAPQRADPAQAAHDKRAVPIRDGALFAAARSRPSGPASGDAIPAAFTAADVALLTSCREALDQGQTRAALLDCAGLVEAQPRWAPGLLLLAQAHLLARHDKDALRTARQALELDPGLADAHLIVGTVLQDSRPTAAKLAYQTYLRLAPRGPRAAEVRAILVGLAALPSSGR